MNQYPFNWTTNTKDNSVNSETMTFGANWSYYLDLNYKGKCFIGSK